MTSVLLFEEVRSNNISPLRKKKYELGRFLENIFLIDELAQKEQEKIDGY